MTRQHTVAAIVVLVALYDIGIGLFMLFGSSPQLAHGSGTVWATAAEGIGQEAAIVLASLFARLGALSLHVGAVSIVWCATAWRSHRAMAALLVTYLITGIALFASDLRYFSGTPYFIVKQAFGGLWVLAIVLHFWPRR